MAIGSGINAFVRREGSGMDAICGRRLMRTVLPLVEPVEWSSAKLLFCRLPGHGRLTLHILTERRAAKNFGGGQLVYRGCIELSLTAHGDFGGHFAS